MAVFVALLRAVNVGGTGKLPMKDLKVLCVDAGFEAVQTYIASGNVVFRSTSGKRQVQRALESALHAYAGKPVGVVIRTRQEMAAVLQANPFPDAAPNHTLTLFLDRAVNKADIAAATGANNEAMALGKCEIYIHYRDGIATSRLKLPAAEEGTARNLNTVAKLVAIADDLQ